MTDRFRVLIVEDEAPARAAVRALLERDPEVEVVGETWGTRSVEAIAETRPDLVFLDIRMPRMNGFEVLRRLDPEALPAVVFVTAYEEHAVEAFEVRALDYVLKPFTDARLAEALGRAKERLRERDRAGVRDEILSLLERMRPGGGDPAPGGRGARAQRIVLDDGGGTLVLPPGRMSWIEASGPYVVVHAEGREYLVRTSLAAMEERLAPHGFVRVHRSALVGLDHVREVRPTSHGDAVIVLRDGTRVRLSRSRRERFEGILRVGGVGSRSSDTDRRR
jgi:two-component system LytT family response regulator